MEDRDGHTSGARPDDQDVRFDGAVTRRGFLGGTAGLAGVLAAAKWATGTATAVAAPTSPGGGGGGSGESLEPTDARLSGDVFLFDLEGVRAGRVDSVAGGEIVADVVTEKIGGDAVLRKRPGRVKYGDITLRVGRGLSPAVYDWISSTWSGALQRKNGSIVACDYDLETRAVGEFENALLTETTIPALDATSKDPGRAHLTLKFAPEVTRYKKASGKAAPIDAGKQKKWLPSNFRLVIGDLPCSRVSKVDSLTIKQSVVTDDVGEQRDSAKEPTKLEFPNLKVSFAAEDAARWIDWHDDFVIRGNNGQDKELSGVISLLAEDRATPWAEIDLRGVGIVALTTDPAEGESDRIRRVKAELYCEEMKFRYLE